MDFSSIDPVVLIASLMVASTSILLAATGELIVEKSGVLNLGVEGMMIIGAICGFIICVEFNSPILGLFGAALGGAFLSIIFGLVTQILLANQVASGLALTMFGLGLASLLGHSYTGIKPPYLAKPEIPLLADIPILGRVLFQHDFVVYFSIISVVIVWYILKKTRLGLIIKAVGENQDSAHALGYVIKLGFILLWSVLLLALVVDTCHLYGCLMDRRNDRWSWLDCSCLGFFSSWPLG